MSPSKESVAPVDPKVARAIARHLDRRRMRRRLLGWLVLLGLIAAAAMYATCGTGFGLGGKGKGEGPGGGGDQTRGSARALVAKRCELRVGPSGITLDGKAMLRDEAVAAAKSCNGVDLYPSGDVRSGDVKDLQEALSSAGVSDVVEHPGAPSPSAVPPSTGSNQPRPQP